MQQLFYNLMNNAADALRPFTDRKKVINIAVRYLSDERQVEIELADNGVGINKDNLAKVFKERFTTKERGHGFGLLSVRRAVENHGGSIQVRSDEGTGTRFIVRLPVKQTANPRWRTAAGNNLRTKHNTPINFPNRRLSHLNN